MSEHGFQHILAFDCSGASCSAAVWVEGGVRAERFAEMERGQAEALMPQIRDVLDDAAVDFTTLDVIATTIGPGSFTGLRLGLAAGRGLALAADRPIVALTSFEAILAGLSEERRAGRPVAIAIDSRRGTVFTQLFDSDLKPARPPVAVEPADFDAWLPPEPFIVVGDGTSGLASASTRTDITLFTEPRRIHAGDIARLARQLGPAGIGRLKPSPLYLRAPDVTLPKGVAAR
jgi:tRNA threonylcarbamoyladenosine biosynthesis protein TsaB